MPMKESKRELRKKSVSQTRTESLFKPSERVVGEIELFNTVDSDNTFAMNTYIAGLINYAGEDGIPSILHFYITKNKNTNLTDSNKVLSLKIPIIPMICNINSRESINSFIKNAKDPQTISSIYDCMDDKEKNQKIEQYTSKIMTYITTELALRYIVAKRNNDRLIMDQISKLKVMKEQDFDFALFEAIINNPKGLRHKTDGHYLVFENKGKEDYVQISDTQSQKYPIYKTMLDKYGPIQKQITSLNSDIETFRNYDINEHQTSRTIGGHSLLNKLRGNNVVSVKNVKPVELGEEE